MQVEIKIDSAYTEPKIILFTAAMTKELHGLVNRLSGDIPTILTGRKEKKVEILEPSELIRVYANAGTVCAVTKKGDYTLRLRLYEAEELLDPSQFVRISNSELINLKEVDHFDLRFTGTICVKLSDGATTYVSRRYVPKLKKILGL